MKYAFFAVCLVCTNVAAQEPRIQAGSVEAARLFQDARTLQQEKKFAAAIAQWQAFLRQYPLDPVVPLVYQGLGTCQLEAGDFDLAVDTLDQAARRMPLGQEDSARWNLAIALGRRGEARGSDADFGRASSLFQGFALNDRLPQDKRAAAYKSWGDMEFALAELAEKNKRWAEAAQSYTAFKQKFPDHAKIDAARLALVDVYAAQGRAELAEKELSILENRPGNPHPDFVLHRSAEMLSARGKYDEAAYKWALLLDRHPTSRYRSQAYRLRGEALSQVPAQRREAFQILAAWVQQNPADPAAGPTLYRTATLAYNLGDFREARDLALQVRQRASDRQARGEAAYLCAQASVQLKDFPAGFEYLQEYLQVDPNQRNNPEVQIVLARCQTGLMRFDDALATYTNLLTNPLAQIPEPDRIRAEAILAGIQHHQELTLNERRWLQDLAKDFPRSGWTAEAHLKVAHQCAKKLVCADALGLTRIALETQSLPHRPASLFLSGFCSLQLKKTPDAINYFQALIDHHPTFDKIGEARYSLAVALQASGRPSDALQAYQQFTLHHTAHPFASKALEQIEILRR